MWFGLNTAMATFLLVQCDGLCGVKERAAAQTFHSALIWSHLPTGGDNVPDCVLTSTHGF